MPKVLIVDDEPQYGEYLREWLARDGHEVKTAATAEDAIAYGQRWHPHVLVADWMLSSQFDGLQVTEAVRAANPALQTILITGYPSPELKARAEKARVFTFIEKPFSLTEVSGAVREAAGAGRPLLPGELLIVSESVALGGLARDVLRAAHYEVNVTTNAEDARRLVCDNERLRIVILDGVAPATDWGILSEELCHIRPDLIVVGSSEGDDAEQLASLGIERFLSRFWTIDDLHNLLLVLIETCTECGLPLPLRRSLPGDQGMRWECAMCGACYHAVLVDNASEELRCNVRAAGR